MEERELKNISGGAINATLLNAIIRGASLLYELGRSIGSSLSRVRTGKYC